MLYIAIAFGIFLLAVVLGFIGQRNSHI